MLLLRLEYISFHACFFNCTIPVSMKLRAKCFAHDVHSHLYLMFLFSDDEGRDLYRKRGTEFKLPYPIIDLDPNEFEAGLLPAVDHGAFDAYAKPVAATTTTIVGAMCNKKTPKSRPETRKRKSQQNRDSNTGVISGSHIVKRCVATPSLVNQFKTEALTSPVSVRGGNVTGGFESEFYRGAGYHPVLAATESALQCAIDSSRYYLDQYCATATGNTGDHFAAGPDSTCGGLSGSRYPGCKTDDLYPSGAAMSVAGTKYHPDANWFDVNGRTTGGGTPAAAEWAAAVGGLLDPAAWLGPSSCWYRPPTAVAGSGVSTGGHLASIYDRHQFSSYYGGRRQETVRDDHHRVPGATAEYQPIGTAFKPIDSNSYDLSSSVTSSVSTGVDSAIGKSSTTNNGYPIYDTRLPTPPDDDTQPQLSYTAVRTPLTSTVDDICRQKTSSSWNRDDVNGTSTANSIGCSFGVATPVIQLTGKKRYEAMIDGIATSTVYCNIR